VDKVVETGTNDEGPLYVCPNSSVVLEAKPAPPTDAPWMWVPRDCDIAWSIESKPDGSNPSLTPNPDYPYDRPDKARLSNLDKRGDYVVKAASSCDGHSDTITVTAIEVASLLPDVGTEIDDGDGNPNTKSFAVCVCPGVVTVTATPNPGVSEEDLPDCWALAGGIGTSRLTRTVDRTTPAKTILTCTCGSSSKTTRIYVVKVDVDAGLSELNEINPGKYINVNWDDDDSDGWAPNDTPPNGVYTGDKDDPYIVGGDNDFRSFIVSISPSDIPSDFSTTKVSVTFGGKVKVWQTNTKKTVLGDSSELTSGDQFKVANLPKQFYLEGVTGSGAFRDVDLKATYVPCDANDIVKVTVFEVTLTGLFGYGNQQSDNDKKHSAFKGSSDKNGKIS
jgi:hypothetical protein